MKPTPHVTGEEIIQELVKNLDQSLEPLLYTVLAPSVFDVYLHPDDLDRLRGIVPTIIDEARRALDERLEGMRREAQPRGLKRLLSGQPQRVKEFKSVAGGWYLSFHENLDPDAAVGDILIESRLTLPPAPELGAGSRTKRISTLRSQGASKLIDSRFVSDAPTELVTPLSDRMALPASSLPPAGPPAGSLPAPGAQTVPVTAPARATPSSSPAPAPFLTPQPGATAATWPSLSPADRPDPNATTDRVGPSARGRSARLTWQDNAGSHTFTMTQGEIVLGRGGTGHWVDVKLETLPDVSRTHAKIRRDDSGTFYLKDVSAYGTSLNGARLPSSIETVGERKLDRNREVALPPRGRISLADVIHIDFEVLDT